MCTKISFALFKIHLRFQMELGSSNTSRLSCDESLMTRSLHESNAGNSRRTSKTEEEVEDDVDSLCDRSSMEGAAFGGGGSQGNEGPCRLCLLSSLSNKSLDEGGSGQGMLKIVEIKVQRNNMKLTLVNSVHIPDSKISLT